MNELCIPTTLPLRKSIFPNAFSASPRPPTPSPVSLSPSLAPRPVTSCPRCEDDRIISVMSSKGKWEAASGAWGGGGGGGGRTVLPAILASAMTCCDTRERHARHTRFISFTVGCQWLHSPPPTPAPTTQHQTFSLENAVKWGGYSCRNDACCPSHMMVRAQLCHISVLGRIC